MKNGLITGASGGIGLALTKRLAADGLALTLVARNADKLQRIVAALPGTGHQYLRADLSSPDDIKAIARHLAETHYDVLINNAGVGIYGRFAELDLDEQMQMMTLNCDALVVLSYAFLSQARTGDALMNIASTLGFSSFPGAAAYAGTKGFVVRFSESLYYEFKQQGVYVVAFCPGVTATNFHEAAGESEEAYPEIIIQTPDEVAREAVRALKKRKKPAVVSGTMNRLMLLGQRFLSRKQVVTMMGRVSPVQ